MASFITPSELKDYPLPVTSQQWSKIGDDQLAIVIGYASDHLEDFLDRKVATGNYVDRILQGSGTEFQMLGVYPIVAVNYVTSYDGMNNATVHPVSDFWIDNEAAILEWLTRDTKQFTKAKRWLIDYNAGFSSTPGPVKFATGLQTIKMLQPMFRGGSNFTEVELIEELDEQIVELLDYYKRRRIS